MKTRSAIGAFCALLLGACARPPAAPPRAPDVVLITIDTLRADRLSCYGYAKPTTPHIDRLAAEGVVFSNAYATCSWTAPSMASLFTALYPRQHGVLHGVAGEYAVERQEKLADSFLTLAEVMKQAGYTTFAVLSNGHASRETGFDQGFDHFESLWFKSSPLPNERVALMKKKMRQAPKYFLWIHYFDPHSPYDLQEDWVAAYAADPGACREWSGVTMRDLRDRFAEVRKNPRAVQALSDLYDGEINYCDEYVGDLLRLLELDTNSMVILSSDHGEEFLEHQSIGHGESLFEPVVHVPLIIRFPGNHHAGRTIASPVSNKNILPTLVDALGLHLPEEPAGESLMPLIDGGPAPTNTVYMELDRGANWKALRRDRWKYIQRLRAGKFMLFDLVNDPGETDRRAGKDNPVAAELGSMLEDWMTANPPFAAPRAAENLSPDQKESLRSLGYLR